MDLNRYQWIPWYAKGSGLGDSPVWKELDGIDGAAAAEVLTQIELLVYQGLGIVAPGQPVFHERADVKKFEGDLYELRVPHAGRAFRVLFYGDQRCREIVVLTVFHKSEFSTPKKALQTAQSRLRQWEKTHRHRVQLHRPRP